MDYLVARGSLKWVSSFLKGLTSFEAKKPGTPLGNRKVHLGSQVPLSSTKWKSYKNWVLGKPGTHFFKPPATNLGNLGTPYGKPGTAFGKSGTAFEKLGTHFNRPLKSKNIRSVTLCPSFDILLHNLSQNVLLHYNVVFYFNLHFANNIK